jgi:hypothetical protein
MILAYPHQATTLLSLVVVYNVSLQLMATSRESGHTDTVHAG